jgi:hypothetical protein
MTAQTDMRDAIAAALTPTEDTAPEAEVTDGAPVDGGEAASTPEAGDERTDEATPVADADETPEAPEGTGDEEARTYFGVDLSGLSAEEADAIVKGFEERDKFIQKLLRNQPETAEPEVAAEDATPDEGEALTDDDIKKALGLDDPDDAYAEHTAKAAVPLAKMVLELQETVTALQTQTQVQATERLWEETLSSMEKQFGALPIDRNELYKQAAEAGVAEPVDAYWRVMGPARQQVMAEVQKRREAMSSDLKKGAKGNVRPTDTADGVEAPIKAKDVKDATRQALARIVKERGITFDGDDDD